MCALRTGAQDSLFCGCSLISPSVVLTAAHCLANPDLRTPWVDVSVGCCYCIAAGSYGYVMLLYPVETLFQQQNLLLLGDGITCPAQEAQRSWGALLLYVAKQAVTVQCPLWHNTCLILTQCDRHTCRRLILTDREVLPTAAQQHADQQL